MSTEFTGVSNGQTIDADHVNQFADPINDLESGAALYREASGSGAPFVVSFTKTDNPNHHLDSLVAGQVIVFKANTDSPASASLQVTFEGGGNSGAIPLNVADTQLGLDEILEDQIVVAIYNDTTTPRFDVVGLGGSGGAASLNGLSDVTISSATTDDFIKHDGTDFKNVTPSAVRTALDVPTNSDLTTGLAGKANSTHTHAASDITSGTLAVVRGGTGGGDAATARSNLGAQVQDDYLDDIAGLTLAKGDILVHDGTDVQKLSVGSNGQVLEADSAQTMGVKWATPSGGGGGASDLDGLSDVVISGTPGSGEVLQHNGTNFVNVTPSSAGLVQTSRTVSTTSPLAGGGALSSDLTLSMPAATSGQSGYLSSTDWSTFNAKQSTSEKGQVNGYAELDSSGKVPAAQLPTGSGIAIGAGQIGYGTAGTGVLTSDSDLTYDGSTLIYSGANAARLEGSGTDAVALGKNAGGSGASAVSIGHDSDATEGGNVAIGSGAQATGNNVAIAIGCVASASGNQGTALGYDTDASGSSSTALGTTAEASGQGSVALGSAAQATQLGSIAISGAATGLQATTVGYLSAASAQSAIALGHYATVSGSYGTGVGYGATASGTYSTALGYVATASGLGSNAIGRFSESAGIYSSAFGYMSSSAGSQSTAVGPWAESQAASSIALGYYAEAAMTESIAIGANSAVETGATLGISIGNKSVTGANHVRVGNGGTGYIAAGSYGVSVGNETYAGWNNSVAVGGKAKAGSDGVGGTGGSAFGCDSYAVLNCVALGYQANAGHSGAVALGAGATTTAASQFVVGSPTVGVSSVWIGQGVTSATPDETSFNATGGSGTNIDGADLRLCGGMSTGSGAGGAITLETSPSGSTGTSQNTLYPRLKISGDGEIGMFGVDPVARSTGWSVSNPNTRKSFDTTTITLSQLAEVVGTLVDYFKTLGPLGA